MTGAARTVARAALLVAGLTVLARVTGFGRVLVFARTVGNTCLGDTYQTVNTVPNVVYEIVAGGALAGVVVPLLAGAVGAGDRDRVTRTSSALLTWTVAVLTPVAVLVALLAEPIAGLLLGGKDCAAAVDVGAGMLRVFAPQIVLYGTGIVLTGVLQAHERFAGPALAPLVSSVVVIAAYLLFAAVAPRGVDVDAVSTGEQLVLSLGTTLGVVALTGTLLAPLARLGLRLRPSFAFPPGAAARVRALAGAGAAALAGQQAAVAAALWLGNNAGAPEATVVTVTYAQAVFLLPWGVLAVPVATGAFPLLSARAEAADDVGFAGALAGATRAVLLVSAAGAAALVAAARPVARVVVEGAPGVATVDVLTAGLVALAPGLLGYGLYALHTRALYARGRAGAAAAATAVGWLVAVAAEAVLALALPDDDRVVALGLGNTVGMCALGALLVRAVAGSAGPRAVAGAARTTLAGLAAAAAGAGAGALLVRLLPDGGLPGAVAQALAAGAVAAGVFLLLVLPVAGDDLRALRRTGLARRAVTP